VISKALNTAALLGIVALGTALRLYDLDAQSFWVDEGWSSLMAQPGNWRYWPVNEHPPLFYALLSLWLRVSQSDYWFRLLPAALGIATIPVIYLLGRHLFDKSVGLLAALLLAVAGFHIRYSRDLTAYTLETFLFTATLLALAIASRRMATTPAAANGAWVSYALCGSLLAYSQGIAPMYVELIAVTYPVLAEVRSSWREWKPWLIANAVITVAFLPWVRTYLARIQDISGTFWIERPTPLDPLLVVYDLTVASIPSLRPIIQAKFGIGLGGFGAPWLWALPLYLLLVASVLIGARRHKRQTATLGILLLAPIAVVYAVSITIRPILIPRQLLPTLVPLVLLLAYGTSTLAGKPGKTRVATITVLVGLFSLSATYHLRYMQKEEWRDVAALLRQHLKHGDTVVFFTYGHPSGHPGPAPHLVERYAGTPVFGETRQLHLHQLAVRCKVKLEDCLNQAVGSEKPQAGIWVIESHERYVPETHRIATWISSSFDEVERHTFTGAQVRRMRFKANHPGRPSP
jgi:4-amino-4-deoxy-L-arabinose transferase-like glycosyltransferase